MIVARDFNTLNLGLVTALDGLGPERISSAAHDPTIKRGLDAHASILHRKASIDQDRRTRLARDASRERAVGEAMMQGMTRVQAKAIVDSYLGPASTQPVPDPDALLPTEQEAQAMQEAIERLQQIAKQPLDVPEAVTYCAPPGPVVLVRPGVAVSVGA